MKESARHRDIRHYSRNVLGVVQDKTAALITANASAKLAESIDANVHAHSIAHNATVLQYTEAIDASTSRANCACMRIIYLQRRLADSISSANAAAAAADTSAIAAAASASEDKKAAVAGIVAKYEEQEMKDVAARAHQKNVYKARQEIETQTLALILSVCAFLIVAWYKMYACRM
jgi:hypothetical protein